MSGTAIQIVPLQAVASQQISATLSNQSVTLNVYQLNSGVYMDVILSGAIFLAGVSCQNGRPMILGKPGFAGEFIFWDQTGSSDPYYTGLGTRYLLCYYAT